MNIEKTFTHTSNKNEYKVKITFTANSFEVFLEEKFAFDNWKTSFDAKFIEEEITKKTGHPLTFAKFS